MRVLAVVERFRPRVSQVNGEPSDGGNLRDAVPHRARADDGNRTRRLN